MLGGALWGRTRSEPPTSATASGSSLPTPVKYDADGGRGATDNYHGLGWQAKFGDDGFGSASKYPTGYVPPEHAPGVATSRLYPTPMVSDASVSINEQVLQGVEDGRYFDQLARRVRADQHRKLPTPTCTQPRMPQATLEARMDRRQGDTSVPLIERLQREDYRRRDHQVHLSQQARDVRLHPTPTSLNGLRGGSQSEHHPGMWQSPGHPEFGELSPEWVEWIMGWPRGWTSTRPMDPEDFLLWEVLARGPDGQALWWAVDPSDVPDAKMGKTVAKGNKRQELVREARIAALGNGQVSAVTAAAYVYLAEDMGDPPGA